MIRTGCFSVIAVFVAAIMMFSLLIVPASAADNENMIYVSSEGNDSGDGSASSPFRTIKKAITTAATKHDGDATVVISGTIEHTDKEGSEFTFPKWSKNMKVIGDNGGKIDFKNEYGINFKFSGPIFFDDLEFSFGGYKDSQISRIVRFYNQGNRLEFGEHMVCETNSGSLYIIGRGVDSEEKGVFLRGGAVGTIWLALDTSATANDVYLTVSDNATVQTVFTGSSGTSGRYI